MAAAESVASAAASAEAKVQAEDAKAKTAAPPSMTVPVVFENGLKGRTTGTVETHFMVRRANLKPPPTNNSEASASAPPRNADPRAVSTGAVGSAVEQIAKIKGCRAVGSAGGAETIDSVACESLWSKVEAPPPDPIL